MKLCDGTGPDVGRCSILLLGDYLISLLRDGENAWQMGVLGSRRSDELRDPFLSAVRGGDATRIVDPPLSYFCTAVDKGLWKREALRFCEREGVPVDLSARKVETWRTDWSRLAGRFGGPPVRAMKHFLGGAETTKVR